MDVRAYCDMQYEIQKRAGEGCALSYDWFGRSSNPPNHKLTQHFAEVLENNGLIEERSSARVYSVDDGRFLPGKVRPGGQAGPGRDHAAPKMTVSGT